MARITLDAETFKALASSTRLTVLRALDERRKTLTELADGLGLNKATVHEHLQLLTAAGLVRKRDDEGRKWIYYELTWTGQSILHPQETTTFNVLLGLSVAAAGGGFVMLGRALGWWLSEKAATVEEGTPPPGPTAQGADASGAPEEGLALRAPAEDDAGAGKETFFDDDGWIALALLAVAVLFTVLAAVVRRKLRPAASGPPSPPAE